MKPEIRLVDVAYVAGEPPEQRHASSSYDKLTSVRLARNSTQIRGETHGKVIPCRAAESVRLKSFLFYFLLGSRQGPLFSHAACTASVRRNLISAHMAELGQIDAEFDKDTTSRPADSSDGTLPLTETVESYVIYHDHLLSYLPNRY